MNGGDIAVECRGSESVEWEKRGVTGTLPLHHIDSGPLICSGVAKNCNEWIQWSRVVAARSDPRSGGKHFAGNGLREGGSYCCTRKNKVVCV